MLISCNNLSVNHSKIRVKYYMKIISGTKMYSSSNVIYILAYYLYRKLPHIRSLGGYKLPLRLLSLLSFEKLFLL